MKNRVLLWVFCILAIPTAANSQDPAQPAPVAEGHSAEWQALINQVADDVGKEFVVDPRLGGPPAYTTADEVDYETLQAMLKMSGFTAMETSDHILVVPEQLTRSRSSRILQHDDPGIPDHEIVTRIIEIPESSTAQAPQLVPVLRPMMPQTAQLGAVPNTNTLILVDRYDNIRRMTAIIEEIVGELDD